MLCFVLIDQATSASPLSTQVTPDWLARVAGAITLQLNRDVAPYWPEATGAVVRTGSGPSDLNAGEIAFGIVDTLPAAPGAIAYHDVTGLAVPYALLALSTCNTLDDVSVAISHECCETAGDADCNLWADAGTGFEYARELCDAVESNIYLINDVSVSDFLLPAFFAMTAPAPFNWLATQPNNGASAPGGPFLTGSGGYQIQRQSGGGETQVFGTPRRLEARKHFTSRTYRRGVRL